MLIEDLNTQRKKTVTYVLVDDKLVNQIEARKMTVATGEGQPLAQVLTTTERSTETENLGSKLLIEQEATSLATSEEGEENKQEWYEKYHKSKPISTPMSNRDGESELKSG